MIDTKSKVLADLLAVDAAVEDAGTGSQEKIARSKVAGMGSAESKAEPPPRSAASLKCEAREVHHAFHITACIWQADHIQQGQMHDVGA